MTKPRAHCRNGCQYGGLSGGGVHEQDLPTIRVEERGRESRGRWRPRGSAVSALRVSISPEFSGPAGARRSGAAQVALARSVALEGRIPLDCSTVPRLCACCAAAVLWRLTHVPVPPLHPKKLGVLWNHVPQDADARRDRRKHSAHALIWWSAGGAPARLPGVIRPALPDRWLMPVWEHLKQCRRAGTRPQSSRKCK